MKENKNKPQIRFKGFTDDWEQRKLGEVFNEYSIKNREDLPPLTIIQGGGTIRRDKSDRNLLYDESNLSNYKMVNKGDFVVHLRSFEGGLEMATNTGIISPAYHTLHGENTDSRFFYSHFRSKNFINIGLTPHVYGIRDGRSIDIEGMKTIQIPYTSYEEQKMIGDFIESINKLTLLHQRKCDEIQKIIKNIEEGIFTEKIKIKKDNGELFDEWQMNNIGFYLSNYSNKNNQELNPVVSVGKYGIRKREEIYSKELSDDISHNKVIDKNTMIIGMGSTQIDLGFHLTDEKFSVSPAYITFHIVNINPLFFKYLMNYYNKELSSLYMITGARQGKSVDKNNLLTHKLRIPTSLKEQEKIANILLSLYQRIDKEIFMINKLKELKSVMLDKMFI